jgi:hypothetical protein
MSKGVVAVKLSVQLLYEAMAGVRRMAVSRRKKKEKKITQEVLIVRKVFYGGEKNFAFDDNPFHTNAEQSIENNHNDHDDNLWEISVLWALPKEVHYRIFPNACKL